MQNLQKKLDYTFNDDSLALTAMTHSSYANERGCESNERLEFLGDSILGMVTASKIYAAFPNMPEGDMTRLRAELVCEESLWNVADKLDLGSCLRLGRGEESTGGRQRRSIMADCVEALIAALYLDGGLELAKDFIERNILYDMNGAHHASRDSKTALQEFIQREPGRRLSYEPVGESGPDHMKTFTVRVLLDGRVLGEGSGRSKKQAEQEAAARALKELEK